MSRIIRLFVIELQKEKRTGVIPLLPVLGLLGALYAFAFFSLKKDTLFNLSMAPMDILLTQVYGIIAVLNMFGIISASCMIYSMEFNGNAIKKMYLLPVRVSGIYLCKFVVLTALFLAAVCFQNLAIAKTGMANLPPDTFDCNMLLSFAGYSFITSMPVLSFMLFAASRFPNMWVPLGIGVAGFLSGMALAVSAPAWLWLHPFVLMLRPAVAMTAQPDHAAVILALAETGFFLFAGSWAAENLRYE